MEHPQVTEHLLERGTLDRGDGIALAWARRAGSAPTIVFLPGFRSDMEGSKAVALDAWCADHGRAILRLDYAGHGASTGTFTNGTIGSWRDDALCLIDQLTSGPVLLVGSSMGGWIALLVALARPARIAGLVGLAAAPDFTENLMWDAMAPPERATLQRDGLLLIPSQYGDPTPVTRALIEDGRRHLVLGGAIAITAPVRLLHGQADPDVPWETALKLSARLDSADVRITLVKDGDHRLSRPADLALLAQVIAELLGFQDGGESLAITGIVPGDP
jgi:pimeloyl-ACP methyl ester carboxylesterase